MSWVSSRRIAILRATLLAAPIRRVPGRAFPATSIFSMIGKSGRFFPTLRDETFGYVLHPIDLATNKAMAAAGRREPRDIVDLVMIHNEIVPLGAVIWGAVEKSIGFTPEGLINEIRGLARYTASDFNRVDSNPPVDSVDILQQLRQALDKAEDFLMRMPTDKAGLLFL
jgi:hypothetical protein